MIDDKIKSLGKYFGGFDVLHDKDENGKETTFKLLKIWLPVGWETYSKEENSYSLTPRINPQNNQCELYGVGNIEFSNMCDFAQELIKYNLDKKSKYDLFRKISSELETIFNENNLESLQTLSFSFNNSKIDDAKLKKQNKKQEDRGLLVENKELTNSKTEL